MKSRFLLLFLFALFAFTQPAKAHVTATYNKFEDYTHFETKQVYGNFSNPIYVYGSFIVGGGRQQITPLIMFEDRGVRTGYKWTGNHDVIVLADNQKVKPQATEQDAYYTSSTEVVFAQFSAEDFLKIANASTVEVQVGGYQYTLTEKMILELRELAHYLQKYLSSPHSASTPALAPLVAPVPEE